MIEKVRKFIESLKNIPWFVPDGNPKPEWRIFYADTWDAAWRAAHDAGDAAWVDTRDAAWRAARDAVRCVAQEAAWDAAGDAALRAAHDDAWRAAWDAALYAACLVVEDKINKKHIEHAAARMEVWQKGYALLYDVDGILYVYALGR